MAQGNKTPWYLRILSWVNPYFETWKDPKTGKREFEAGLEFHPDWFPGDNPEEDASQTEK